MLVGRELAQYLGCLVRRLRGRAQEQLQFRVVDGLTLFLGIHEYRAALGGRSAPRGVGIVVDEGGRSGGGVFS